MNRSLNMCALVALAFGAGAASAQEVSGAQRPEITAGEEAY